MALAVYWSRRRLAAVSLEGALIMSMIKFDTDGRSQ